MILEHSTSSHCVVPLYELLLKFHPTARRNSQMTMDKAELCAKKAKNTMSTSESQIRGDMEDNSKIFFLI